MKLLLLCLVTLGFSSLSFAYPCTISEIKKNTANFCDPRREAKQMTESELRALFNEVQASLEEFILQGRDEDDLSAEEKSIYKRISTVEFAGWDNCGNNRSGEPSVSASYDTTKHNVKFCDGLKNFPIPALVTMIGHEIGHSADSCASQNFFVQANNRSILRLPRNFSANEAVSSLVEELQRSQAPIALTTKLLMERPDVVEGWRKLTGVSISEPMPLNRYPLNQIRRCLIDQDNVWRSPAGENGDTIVPNRETAPACNTHSDSESLADVWGAYALGKYFERHPEKRGNAAIGMFESRKNEICSVKGYPAIISRLESIWIAAPGVAQALGCEAVPARSCLRETPFPAAAVSSPVRTSSTPARAEPEEGDDEVVVSPKRDANEESSSNDSESEE